VAAVPAARALVARNDQVTRQWHLLRRLEASRGLTLEELADSLPADLPRHLRTLRRDLVALEGVGFPLITERNDGRTRWKLVDGFHRLPVLGFAPTELMALVLSRDLLRPLEGTNIHAALESALGKVATALPPSGLDFVRRLPLRSLWAAQDLSRSPRAARPPDPGYRRPAHRAGPLRLGLSGQDRSA
jgi:predicted DNA-binding transcriptional regulator YafY